MNADMRFGPSGGGRGFGSWRGSVPFGRVRLWLIGWAVAEVALLVVVVKTLGLGGALLLTVGTGVLGIVLLRRLGLGAAQRVRAAMLGGASRGSLMDGTASGLGALLLILPGFATDLVGLALVTPSVRRAILARLGDAPSQGAPGKRRAAPPGIIDLAPDDWSAEDGHRSQ